MGEDSVLVLVDADVAALLLVLELSGMGANRNYKATGTNVAGQTYLDRDQPVSLEEIP